MKVEVAGCIRYPDAVVYCKPLPPTTTVIKHPVVVSQVLSAGTSRTDAIDRLHEYQATASIQRYVILEQECIAATMFARHRADWTAHKLTAGDVLRMPEIEVEFPLADIYADVQVAMESDDGGVNEASGST
jgi:Uma2 family endonuclease